MFSRNIQTHFQRNEIMPKKSVIVLSQTGNLIYPSRKEFEAAEHAIRRDAVPGVPLIGEALDVACYVLSKHPRAEELLPHLQHIIVDVIDLHGALSRAYAVMRTDGTTEHFSKAYALLTPFQRDVRFASQNRDSAMLVARRAVAQQMLAAKRSLPEQACSGCDGPLTALTAELHHDKFRFRDIFDSFFGTQPAVTRDPISGERDFADQDVKARWSEFYRRAAVYRLVCSGCNSAAETGIGHHSKDHLRRAA
jgi:hypothetical protein